MHFCSNSYNDYASFIRWLNRQTNYIRFHPEAKTGIGLRMIYFGCRTVSHIQKFGPCMSWQGCFAHMVVATTFLCFLTWVVFDETLLKRDKNSENWKHFKLAQGPFHSPPLSTSNSRISSSPKPPYLGALMLSFRSLRFSPIVFLNYLDCKIFGQGPSLLRCVTPNTSKILIQSGAPGHYCSAKRK